MCLLCGAAQEFSNFFFASVQWLTNFKLTQASFPFSNKKLFAIVLLVV